MIFCVTHDGIVVAAASGPGETGSLAPAIVPIRADFVGVLLGAVEWNTPDSSAKPKRLDAELPTVAMNAIGHATKEKLSTNRSDIEDIGVAMLEGVAAVRDADSPQGWTLRRMNRSSNCC